jgi:hypothetical protein
VSDDARGLPSRRRFALALPALAGLVILLGLAIRVILLVQPIGGDPGIYAYVGGQILDGFLPYRDVFEQKPPGVLYTYAAAFLVLGRSMTAVQVFDLLAWIGLVALTAMLAWSLWRDCAVSAVAAGLAALFLNPTLQSGFKQVGQTETFLAVWASAAILLTVRGVRTRPTAGRPAGDSGGSVGAMALGAGCCCGLAFLHKYNAVTYLAACAAMLGLLRQGRSRWGALAALAGGFIVPVAVVLAYFWARGGLFDLIDSTVFYNIGYTAGSYGSPADFVARAAVVTYRFLTMNVVWFMGGVGLLMMAVRAWQGDWAGFPLVLFVAAAYLAILANARFYPQYFLQILPPLVICAAFALVRVLGAMRKPAHALAAVLFLAGTLWVGCRHTPVVRIAGDLSAAARFAAGSLSRDDYYFRFGGYGNGGDFSLLADVQLAAFLGRHTRSDQTIYIYGGEPLVLFLAGRRSPSRFIWNDPFLTGGFRGRYTTADLVRELEGGRPAYIVVIKNDQNMVDPVDSLSHFRQDARLRDHVSREYREVGWMEDFLLFRRKDL